jgi:hypothetical protein
MYSLFLFGRLKCDTNTSTLAPSYRTLFRNVDRTVDNDGYENVYPLHLKTITIAGLPVEEIPCVEVYDLSGKVSVCRVVVGDLLGCTGRMVTLCVLNSHWNVAIPEIVFIGRFGCVLCSVVVYTRLLSLFAR